MPDDLQPDYPKFLYLFLDLDEGYLLCAGIPCCDHLVLQQVFSYLPFNPRYAIVGPERSRLDAFCKTHVFVERDISGGYFIV